MRHMVRDAGIAACFIVSFVLGINITYAIAGIRFRDTITHIKDWIARGK